METGFLNGRRFPISPQTPNSSGFEVVSRAGKAAPNANRPRRTTTGAAAITFGAMTTSATGTVLIRGAAAITFGAMTVSATGTVVSNTNTAAIRKKRRWFLQMRKTRGIR